MLIKLFKSSKTKRIDFDRKFDIFKCVSASFCSLKARNSGLESFEFWTVFFEFYCLRILKVTVF